MSRRAFVVVLDACGVGALPDADAYAADQDFAAMDRAVFRPLMRSLKIDPPTP